MRTNFVRFSDAAICRKKDLQMRQTLIYILLKICLYLLPLSNFYVLMLGLKPPGITLERFIHDLAFHFDLQMSVVELLTPTTESCVCNFFFNFSAIFVEIEKRTRLAQIMFQKIVNLTFREVEKFTDKTQTDRGSFRSSGLTYQKHIR